MKSRSPYTTPRIVAPQATMRQNPTADEIRFQTNGVLTLGVEIELQLLNPTTQNLEPRAEELLLATHHIPNVKPEFYLSTVEINTGICRNVHEVESDLSNTLGTLQHIADARGIELATTGAHPFAKYNDCIISPTERYLQLIDRNQWLTRRMTVYGLHVHIGMASGEDCIRFNNFFMHFLPHLLGLSCSSPFWQGTDTGLASCRPTTYESLPTAGQPYRVSNWHEFEHLYETLKRCGSIESLHDLWWDLRPSPKYGTLEIRVCDGPATLQETTAIVAFIHCLAHWFNDNGAWLENVPHAPYWIARENKWRVIRHGLNAELVMNTEGKIKPLIVDIHEWLDMLVPYADKLGYQTQMAMVSKILKNGPSYARQRKVFELTGSLAEVVRYNVAECRNQAPIWDVETYCQNQTFALSA